MRRYGFLASVFGRMRPRPWSCGWWFLVGHGLCFYITSRLPIHLKEYVVRDAMMHLAQKQGRPRIDHPDGTPADLLWAYRD